MDDGRLPVEMVSGVPVVAAPEEVDITNAQSLRSALLAVAAKGHSTLVADLTRTQFCDVSGVHALVAAHKQVQARGGELLAVVHSAAVLRVFAITGVDSVIPSFASLDSALAHTSASGPSGCRPAPAEQLSGPAPSSSHPPEPCERPPGHSGSA